MTCLLAVTLPPLLALGQAARTADAAGRDLNSPDARRAELAQALAAFDEAVAMKDHGGLEAQRRYHEALNGFEALVQAGVRNGGLYYNTANTYLRLGEVGKAIVNYRRALRLMPGDEKIRKNLASAREMCRVRIAPPATSAFIETLLFWHFSTSRGARTKVALAGYVLTWLLLFVRLLVLRHTPGLPWIIALAAAVTCIVGASVSWDMTVQDRRVEGVLIDEDVVLRKGNGDYYEPQLEQDLSQGVEFRLLETREDVAGARWYHVELRDGKRGWLRADQADVI